MYNNFILVLLDRHLGCFTKPSRSILLHTCLPKSHGMEMGSFQGKPKEDPMDLCSKLGFPCIFHFIKRWMEEIDGTFRHFTMDFFGTPMIPLVHPSVKEPNHPWSFFIIPKLRKPRKVSSVAASTSRKKIEELGMYMYMVLIMYL